MTIKQEILNNLYDWNLYSDGIFTTKRNNEEKRVILNEEDSKEIRQFIINKIKTNSDQWFLKKSIKLDENNKQLKLNDAYKANFNYLVYKPSFSGYDYYETTYCLGSFNDQEWTEIMELSLEKVEPTEEEIRKTIEEIKRLLERMDQEKKESKEQKQFFGNFIFNSRKERNSVLLFSGVIFILLLLLSFAWRQIEK